MTNTDEIRKFQAINDVSPKGGVVFVGSDFFAGLPFAELARSFRIEQKVYNRSLVGATVADVCANMNELILDLNPHKIFINLGEEEAGQGMETAEFIESLEWLLCSIHNTSNADIYIVSLPARSELHDKYNFALKKLCSDSGYRYIDASSVFNGDKPQIDLFKAIKLYIHGELDFTEMMIL